MTAQKEETQKNDNICIKTHKANNELLVAACDAELVGKTLKQSEIEFLVDETFYYDIKGTEKLLKEHLKMATMANLVGKKSVKCGIEIGIIEENSIILIDGVPHAQYVLL